MNLALSVAARRPYPFGRRRGRRWRRARARRRLNRRPRSSRTSRRTRLRPRARAAACVRAAAPDPSAAVPCRRPSAPPHFLRSTFQTSLNPITRETAHGDSVSRGARRRGKKHSTTQIGAREEEEEEDEHSKHYVGRCRLRRR